MQYKTKLAAGIFKTRRMEKIDIEQAIMLSPLKTAPRTNVALAIMKYFLPS